MVRSRSAAKSSTNFGRATGTSHQDYALYLHMSAAKNIGFGLKARKMPKVEIDRRVGEAARMLGITEAMTLAERIVLMRDGLIEQQGAPLDLFERPVPTFVPGFLESPRMSFLPGQLVRAASSNSIRLKETILPLPTGRKLGDASDGQTVLLGLRPEHLTRAHGAAPPAGHVRYDATIELIQPTRSRSYATFSLAGVPVMAELQAHDVSRPGEHVQIDINLMRASVFDLQTERAL